MSASCSRQWFDRVFASFCVVILSPYILYRAMVAIYKTGSCFDIISISLDGNKVDLIHFSGYFNGRKLAYLFNLLMGDIVFVGEGWLIEDLLSNSRNPGNLRGIKNERKPCLINANKLSDRSGTRYEDQASLDLSVLKRTGIMFRYALISLMVSKKSFKRPKVFPLLGVSVDNLTLEHAVRIITTNALEKQKSQFAFVNADCLNIAVKKVRYQDALNRMSAVFADGVGLQIGAKMLGIDLQGNVNGTDMLPRICKTCVNNNLTIYMLGGKPGVADEAAANIVSLHPGLRITGCQHGYFSKEDTQEVINTINQSNADILLVAFGAPLQELWIDEHKEKLNPSVLIGVGGLFDFQTDRISRSPKWVQDVGLEWIWRLKQEPLRLWKRYIVGNPLFLYRVFKQSRSDQHCANYRRFNNPHTAESRRNKRYRRQQSIWLFRIYFQRIGKRIIDIFASAVALICLSPLLIIVALLIKMESKGSILFQQTRVGRYGHEFSMLKFRSMRMDAEIVKSELKSENEVEGGVIFKMKADPRITQVGKYIRRFSIDELPQLINVLYGDMSLVGPRPPLPNEVEMYGSRDRRRLEVVPGITGLWQVSGRSDTTFEEQVSLDIDYLESNGLLNDIVILFKTIPAVVSGKGAY